MYEFLISSILFFLSGFVVDIFYTLYIRYAGKDSKSDRRRAGGYSVMMGLCTTVFVISLETTKWALPFYFLGLYLGTYYALDIEKYIKTKLLKEP